jgi:hypothetical protein
MRTKHRDEIVVELDHPAARVTLRRLLMQRASEALADRPGLRCGTIMVPVREMVRREFTVDVVGCGVSV